MLDLQLGHVVWWLVILSDSCGSLGLDTHRCVLGLGWMEFDVSSFGVQLGIINFETLTVCVKGKNVHAAQFRIFRKTSRYLLQDLRLFYVNSQTRL